MMADTSCLAHPRCGDDNLRAFIEIDCHGIIRRYGNLKTLEGQRIDALLHQCHCGGVIAVQIVFRKHARCFDCKGAVNINLEAVMPMHQPALLDFADKIQHFLRSPDGKGGDDQIAAAVKGLLNLSGKLCHIIRWRSMVAVAVCTFHNDIIRFGGITGVMDDGLIDIADITGEYDFFRYAVFRQPDFDTGGAE